MVVAPPLARLPVLHHLLSILIAIPGHVPPPPPRHAPPPIASVIFFHYSSFFLPYCQKLWGFLGGGGGAQCDLGTAGSAYGAATQTGGPTAAPHNCSP